MHLDGIKSKLRGYKVGLKNPTSHVIKKEVGLLNTSIHRFV